MHQGHSRRSATLPAWWVHSGTFIGEVAAQKAHGSRFTGLKKPEPILAVSPERLHPSQQGRWAPMGTPSLPA